MQEDLKKIFILLSKVAKEKKYAQEYLGLLARRGDIGSIRIGKRWYTTTEWFDELLKDAEARKAETRIEPAENLAVREEKRIEGVFLPEKVELKRRGVDERKFEIEEKIVPLESGASSLFKGKRFETIDLRKIGAGKFSAPRERLAKKASGVEREAEKSARQNAAEQERIIREWKIYSGNVSPDFADSIPRVPLFQKFAFSVVAVLLLALLFQAGFIYRDELKKLAGFESGVVAGAENKKLNLAVIKNSSIDYLGNQGDEVRENISLSRVLIRAAMEKSANSE